VAVARYSILIRDGNLSLGGKNFSPLIGDSSRNKSIEVTLSIQAGLLDKSIEVSVGFVLTVAFVTVLLD